MSAAPYGTAAGSRREQDVVELTAELVAVDSQNPGPGEGQIARAVAGWLSERGIASQLVEFAPGRPNVLATVDRGPGVRLGLSGHLDTKPVGDAGPAWRTDPFELVVQDGMAYGLGTSDMKGAVAAMMVTLERFAAAPDAPSGSLSLVLTADEEQGSRVGAWALARSERLPPLDGLLIGEPSGVEEPWESLHLVSRGICCADIEIGTVQGHSGLSGRLGRNAVLVAADVLRALEDFVPPVARPGRVPALPTVNPGVRVQGGVAFGVWPGRCTVSLEVRTVPGMERGEVTSAIDEVVHRAVAGEADVVVRYVDGPLGWTSAVELDPADPLATAALRAGVRVLGRELAVTAYPGGTDATHFTAEAGVPAVSSLGPGWLSVAHGANEVVGVAQLHEAVDLYGAVVEEYLGA